MRTGDPEDRKHCVPDELLGHPAKPFDLGVDRFEQPGLNVAHVLRVEALPKASRPREICEQDRDNPPLLPLVGDARRACRLDNQRCSAARAE